MQNRWAVVALAAAASFGVVGRAEDETPAKGKKLAGGDRGAIFDRLDKNSDGFLTPDEIPQQLRAPWMKADTDGDGKISREEFLATRPAAAAGGGKGAGGEQAAKRFAEMDKDGDGKISRSEATGFLKRFFDKIDSDKDGYLTKPEIGAYLQSMNGKGQPGAKKGGPGKAAEDAASTGDAKAMKKAARKAAKASNSPDLDPKTAEMFDRLDVDKDGKISRSEAKGKLAENFDKIDADKDGFVSKAELSRVLQAMGAQGGEAGGGERSALQIFMEQDADGDGRVTRAEAKGVLADNFDKLDANKDGKLSRQEVEDGFPRLKAGKK